MILQRLTLLGLWLQLCLVVSIAIEGKDISTTQQDGAADDFAPAAFRDMMPRPDLYSIPCYACLMEECPEVRRYPANTTVWTECNLAGTLAPTFRDNWVETVDGCYINDNDFSYYPHWPTRSLHPSALPICDEEKAHRLPNATTPHLSVRQDATPDPDPVPTYTPATTDPTHDKQCLVCADSLCQTETTLPRNSSLSLECWTVSTMGPGDVISFPAYDERWVMTSEGCYLALSEVNIPCYDEHRDLGACMPYCEPPPHYWAPVKDGSLARECARGCGEATGWVSEIYVADFECWEYGDEVKGNATWYRGVEVELYGEWYVIWWPKAALGAFGGTGEPPERCGVEGNGTEVGSRRRVVSPAKRRRDEKVETKAVGHAAPRAVQVVYAYVNEVDTRCRLCTKRICPYYTVYQPGENMDFTCFVYGSVVDGSDIWLKSGEAVRCYVPRRYVTLNGGASISYCRDDTRRFLSSTDTTSAFDEPPASVAVRAPAPQVSDPSQSPNPPIVDSCQRDPVNWQQWCYNQALSCCVSRTPVELFWDCSSERSMDSWKRACKDLSTRTSCGEARRLGNIMEGCEGGDAYRDPS